MTLRSRLEKDLRPSSAVLAGVLLVLSACTDDHMLGPTREPQRSLTATVPNFKVAFIGDQGNGPAARAVLELIRAEGAHMVMHQGDFDYADDPVAWDNLITSVLGADYPYFASVGNHDAARFYGVGGYQEKLLQRLARVAGATCTGDYGVNSACRYGGLFFVLSGVGTLGGGHEAYLQEQLAADTSVWRICSWHKNQQAMQVGGKTDEVGWLAYETCRQQGAIIATGHEHSYSRTRTLVNTERQTVDPVWPEAGAVRVTPGATFVFVSGLGGQSIRNQERCLPTTFPYGCNGEWASIYTSDQGAQSGALFIEFHVNGDPRAGRGYFKNINGEVVDVFTVSAQPGEPPANQPPAAAFTEACTGLSCDFTDQSTDSDGGVVAWSWDFGDGTTSSVQHPSHTYAASGTYTVNLTATDNDGAPNSATRAVTVSASAAPVVTACSPSSGNRNEQLVVQVTGSDFRSGATVGFGERVMTQSVTFVSATRLDVRIKVHAKASPGSRTVRVTNSDGQSGSLAGCFTVN